MDLHTFSRLASLYSRSFAVELSALLVVCADLSASEAASRLNLHVKTVQDWFEGMYELGILHREQVSKGKRPHFRYSLSQRRLAIELDFGSLAPPGGARRWLGVRIREKKNANAQFSTATKQPRISSISVFSGSGRDKKERKLSLTPTQGAFLYHVPFPSARHRSVEAIMEAAGLERSRLGEVADIVSELVEIGVVEQEA